MKSLFERITELRQSQIDRHEMGVTVEEQINGLTPYEFLQLISDELEDMLDSGEPS